MLFQLQGSQTRIRCKDDHESNVGENLEGSGRGLFKGTVLTVGTWRD